MKVIKQVPFDFDNKRFLINVFATEDGFAVMAFNADGTRANNARFTVSYENVTDFHNIGGTAIDHLIRAAQDSLKTT